MTNSENEIINEYEWMNVSLFGPYKYSSLSGDGTKFAFSSKFEGINTYFANFNSDKKKWELSDQFINFSGLIKMSNDGNTIAISNEEINKVQVYTFNENKWINKGLTFEGDPDDRLGSSLALSYDGSIIAIGSKNKSSDKIKNGIVQVYEYKNSQWNKLGETIEGKMNDEELGSSLDLNSEGYRIVIGSGNGSVRTFGYNGSIWIEISEGLTNNLETDTKFGFSVAMNSIGNIIVIGEPNGISSDGKITGKITVYELNSNQWNMLGKPIYGKSEGDNLGTCVLINEDDTKIYSSSTSSFNEKGEVRFFKFLNNNWEEYINPLVGESEGNKFGTNISINNNGNILSVSGEIGDKLYYSNFNSKLKIYNFIKKKKEINIPIIEKPDNNPVEEENSSTEVVQSEYDEEEIKTTKDNEEFHEILIRQFKEFIEKLKNDKNMQLYVGGGFIFFIILLIIILNKSDGKGKIVDVFETHPPIE
jgi:hypothetical protein